MNCITCGKDSGSGEKCQSCVNKILLKQKIFYYYNDFNTLSDVGSGFIGRIKSLLPSFGTAVIEAGAARVLLDAMNITVSPIFLIGVFIGLYYFWRIAYYLGGIFVKRIGFIKSQGEYGIKNQEHFNPWQKMAQETMINIAQEVGAEHKFKL